MRCILRRSVAAMLALTACSGSDGGGGPAPPAVVVVKAPVSGDAQTGTVGTALANPIRVLVTRDGAPEPGATVTWTATGTGASVVPPTGTTDAQGLAEAVWTLPQAAGARTASAAVAGAGGSPVGFTATALPGPATQLNRTGGNAQSGAINAALPMPLQVTAVDQYGNGVAGVAIAWQVTGGGGSVAPGNGNTSAAGTATTVWTLGGTLGAQAAEGSAGGLAGSPVGFTATGTPPPPPVVNVTVGNNFYSPSATTISAGTQVKWTWVGTGGISHSVTPTGSPSFTGSAILTGAGSTYSFTFTTPGVYAYQCAVHGVAMSGTVTVN
ncbi:MAG TPA: Ig-like domain-containing protein [Gemmatimonadales bacterium]|nr:Ig-like domain-containing protein [Gemmatimonadales bacterium]